MLTGTVSSPCATPVLAVILAYVSTQGDMVYGGSLLFIYALGHCAIDIHCRDFRWTNRKHHQFERGKELLSLCKKTEWCNTLTGRHIFWYNKPLK